LSKCANPKPTKSQGLKHLSVGDINPLWDVLPVIGGNLVSLKCSSGLEGVDWIVKYCPNLEDLDISVKDVARDWLDDDARFSTVELIKSGLKKLSTCVIHVINRSYEVRLGTELVW
jgi:hypothetical protein